MKEKELKKVIRYGKIEKEVDLKTLSSFAIGGKAQWVVEPCDIEEIYKLVQLLTKTKTPYYLLGNGTNVLFLDSGFSGVIIKLAKKFAGYEHDEGYFKVESGCSLSQFVLYANDEGYGGLEGLFGIPGTIGGGIRMNCGAFGYEISAYVKGVMYLDGHTLKYKKKEELNFSYRHSLFAEHPEYIVLRVDFELPKANKEQSKILMQEYLQKRIQSQDLDHPSLGSIFKRNDSLPAPVSKVLDEMGLKGHTVGDAMVSKKHAGFLINVGSASSQNVLDLIQYIEQVVYEKYGVYLEKEIEIVGDKS